MEWHDDHRVWHRTEFEGTPLREPRITGKMVAKAQKPSRRGGPQSMLDVDMIATKGGIMNVAYLSVLSALAGSTLGGMASIVTTWLNQHSQDRSQRHAQSVARRERLYSDFVDEASALFVDALTHDQFDPTKFVQIYATVGKLRLFASNDVVSKADKVMRDIREIYYLPNQDYANRDAEVSGDLNVIQAFSEACRDDLRS
jgi:hypothetical protein